MITDTNNASSASPLASILARLPRSWIVILALVGVASLGMLVAKPMFVAATATNPAAIVRLVGLLVAVLGFSWFIESRVQQTVLRVGLIAIPVAVLGWWMVAPAFTDVRVDAALPTSAADLGLVPAPQASPVASSSEPEADETPTTTPADPTSTAPTSPSSTEVPAQDPAPATTQDPAPAPTQEPAPPQELRRGDFRGLDGHDAEGDAVLYRLSDGSHFLRLEEIDVDNGPGLKLYLVPGRDQVRPVDGSVFLGDLQGNQGSQNYAIPTSVSEAFPAGDLTVLIWCEPFQVAIGGATMS